MELTYWLKQTDSPLFPDILWSRPETKSGSGKLLIIGGNSHGLAAPGLAYNESLSSGVGVVKVVMPDAVKKVVKSLLPDADFVASTPSGSFAVSALADLVSLANWADGVLLAGDFGRNSETAILLEKFINSFKNLLVISNDAIDYFKETPKMIIDRKNTICILSLIQLQKIFINTPTITPIISTMSTIQLVEALHEYTLKYASCIVTKHNGLIFIADSGKISTTKDNEEIFQAAITARVAVFCLQNKEKIFESATSSLSKQNI